MQTAHSQAFYQSYVPGSLVEWSDYLTRAPDFPAIETFQGAVIFVDICDFTRLTAEVTRDPTAGAEKLGRLLTNFFSRVVALIEAHGGTAFHFEGDSVLGGWRSAGRDQPEAWTAVQCAQCAAAIREDISQGRFDGQNVRVRISLGVGNIELVHVGDADTRCHVFLSGDATRQAVSLGIRADAGQILISQAARQLIGQRGRFTIDAADNILLESIDAPPADAAPVRQRSGAEAVRDLSLYLPLALRSRLQFGTDDWVSEMRTLTIVFVKIMHATDLAGHEAVNESVVAVQRSIETNDGSILALYPNQDGFAVLAAFGLPGQAHEDAARSAVMAALKIEELVNEAELSLSMGVTTGQLFCGLVGPAHRRQYTVVGQTANLASRLATVAAGRTLVDEATHSATRKQIAYKGPWQIQVAGIRQALASYTPTGVPPKEAGDAKRHFVNRQEELQFLQQRLQRESVQASEIQFIVGEPGIGKSSLINRLKEMHPGGSIITLQARGLRDEPVPYGVWRPVIRDRLGLTGGENAEHPAAALSDAELADFAPLLNDVVDARIDESRLTATMPTIVRAENLRRLLRQLLLESLSEQRQILILDDAHAVDEPSFELMLDVLGSRPGSLAIVASRTMSALNPLIRRTAESAIGHHVMWLEGLDPAHAMKLTQLTLRNGSVPDWLGDYLNENAGGNPFFVEEICNVVVEKRVAAAAAVAAAESPQILRFPQSIEGAVLSRIDNLPADDQLLIRHASVVGLELTEQQLRRLDPVKTSGMDIDAALQRLLDRQLLIRQSDGTLTFRSRVIHDVVYDSMVSTQRQQAHRAVLRSLEQGGRRGDPELAPELLRHARGAGDRERILTYLDEVAALRLRQFDTKAAISLGEEFLGLSAQPDVTVARERLAFCHLMLGEAYVSNGLAAKGRQAYQQGLRLLGLPLPKSRAGLAASLVGQAAVQIWHRLRGRQDASIATSRLAAETSADLFRRAARAHEELTRIYYFASEKGRLLHATLRATNLAEQLDGLAPQLAINYASLGAICGVIPLRRAATFYGARAARVAAIVDDPFATMRVKLMAGLYQTAVGEWRTARANFEAGQAIAERLGDRRGWCEQAVGLETISGPWLLSDAYGGLAEWDSLAARICDVGRERGDIQVLACGLLGRLRGAAVTGARETAETCLAEARELLERGESDLEPIHVIETAGYLARGAFETGDEEAGLAWLTKGNAQLAAVSSSMKSRTLPALSVFVGACLLRARKAGLEAARAELQLARKVVHRLDRFSRIYPIGRPEYLLRRGDLCALGGQPAKAAALWRRSLEAALRLTMPGAASAAAQRLTSDGQADTESARLLGDFARLLEAPESRWTDLPHLQDWRRYGEPKPA